MQAVEQHSLTREQKEAVGILSIGTLLEYFDLMLYVHMSVLLNELFFPKTDPFISNLVNAFTFSFPFLLRPLGAYLIGRMGDKLGRRYTVVVTSMITAITCLIIATLPTYNEIGIVASYILMLCRVMQGIASLGEIIGAEIYITETVKSPAKFPAVTLIYFSSVLGGCLALALGALTTKYYLNWRIAFWVGAGVAIFGFIARSHLRETPEFADANIILKKVTKNKGTWLTQEPNNIRNIIAMFCIQCAWPVWFYLNYFHCQSILKTNFGYSQSDILFNNFYIALVDLVGIAVIIYLSSIFDPIKILRIKTYIFTPFCLILPFLLDHSTSPLFIFYIQIFIALFSVSTMPAFPIFIKHFSVFKRFTVVNMTFATSRALIYIVTSMVCVLLVNTFSHYGLLFVIIPIMIGYIFGLSHFEKLERTQMDS
jgi:MFS family permease